MIIDTGDVAPIYVVVAFDDSDMTAIDLLRAAELPLVTVSFGGLGEGVCTIVRTGCDISACRQRLCQTGDFDSPFWQFWVQQDAGNWTLSTLGGSQHEVTDGDILSWSWTGTEPQRETLSWDAVVSLAGAPEELVAGNAAGQTGVWMSDPTIDLVDETPPITGTLVSVGVIALLAGAGLFIIRKQRNAVEEVP